jgi:hypothetical protein
LGTKEDIEAGILRETEAELATMKNNVAEHKQKVIVRLLQLVCFFYHLRIFSTLINGDFPQSGNI